TPTAIALVAADRESVAKPSTIWYSRARVKQANGRLEEATLVGNERRCRSAVLTESAFLEPLTVVNIQTAYAKALLIDEEHLRSAQEEGDVLGAHRVLLDAFATDVRPLLGRLASEHNLEPDPVEAFRLGGYAEQLARERGTAAVTSAYES